MPHPYIWRVHRLNARRPAFLLRHGRIYWEGRSWTEGHRRWLAAQRFDHPALGSPMRSTGRY